MDINYVENRVSPLYHCARCLRMGIKLWRPSSTFAVELVCARCAAEEEHEETNVCVTMNAAGRHVNSLGWDTFQIGSYVPAIPTEDGFGYYWYSELIPAEASGWWQRLPNGL